VQAALSVESVVEDLLGTQEAPLSIQPREAPEPFSEIAAAPTYEDIDDLLEEFPEDLVEVIGVLSS